MEVVKRSRFCAGDSAIWNDGVQDIPVTITNVGRNVLGIYCRVVYQLADGSQEHDTVHPSQLRPIPRRLS